MNIKRIFSHISIPKKQEVLRAVKSFSRTRKTVFLVVACIFFVSGISLFSQTLIQPFEQEVPAQGGIHKEGIIGTPRFVNPVLSLSTADKDVESLIFSGLTRKTREGSIILDLAEDFSVSADNLIYTFTIDDNARFQDGEKVTVDDIVFTIQQIQNPEIKSPKRVSWEGIKVEKIDEKTVRFVLSQPFISFLENTSVGILPSYLWNTVPNEEFSFSPLNIEPIGAGKYKVKDITKSKGGAVNSYLLKASRYYSGEKPFIRKIKLYFYEKEENAIKAFRGNDIHALAGISPQSLSSLSKKTTVYTATLNRMFGLFFNQKDNAITSDIKIRQAINLALDREQIIQEALVGFGQAIESPLQTTIETTNIKNSFTANKEKSVSILEQEGWAMNSQGVRQKGNIELSIKLTTAKIPDLEAVAEVIQKELRDIGIKIIIESHETNDLNQYVIRPRNFEMLLFGQIINQEGDIFAFWHSSQTSDPGLNITSYQNKTVDKTLEEIIQTFDINKRAVLYSNFENQFLKDIPALFIYSPQLIYVVRGTIHNVELSPITNSSQRLLDMQEWYTETNHTIPFLSK